MEALFLPLVSDCWQTARMVFSMSSAVGLKMLSTYFCSSTTSGSTAASESVAHEPLLGVHRKRSNLVTRKEENVRSRTRSNETE